MIIPVRSVAAETLWAANCGKTTRVTIRMSLAISLILLYPSSELNNARRIEFMSPLLCVDKPRRGESGTRAKIEPARRQARLFPFLSTCRQVGDDDTRCAADLATP